jgi:predicted nuclease of predicted toxin-antitoxin system
MHFIANENFPFPSSQILLDAGHQIYLIAKECPGITDLQVIEKAQELNALILTFDKDYGEIIFRHKIINPPAVIFFRHKGDSPNFAGETLLKLLTSNKLICNDRFTVIEETGIRQKSYQ